MITEENKSRKRKTSTSAEDVESKQKRESVESEGAESEKEWMQSESPEENKQTAEIGQEHQERNKFKDRYHEGGDALEGKDDPPVEEIRFASSFDVRGFRRKLRGDDFIKG